MSVSFGSVKITPVSFTVGKFVITLRISRFSRSADKCNCLVLVHVTREAPDLLIISTVIEACAV